MRVYKVKNYDEMSRKAANLIAAQIITKPDSVLGLATGSTPVGTYKYLVEKYNNGDLDFSEVKTANLDEYKGLTRESEQSYYYFMYNNLFKDINIDLNNTNIPDGTEPDSEKECARYEAVVESMGGVDIQVLGLGHIGFNEPADEFPKTTHCVDLTESTIEANKRFFADVNDVPRQAYTMGIKTIMSAKTILLLVSGADKAQILHDCLCGPIVPQVPASILQLHGDVIVIADEAAMSKF